MCLINTETVSSYPAGRLFDLPRFFQEILPLLPDMEDIGTVGLFVFCFVSGFCLFCFFLGNKIWTPDLIYGK